MCAQVSLIRRVAGQVIASILPERCPICGGQVQGGGLGQPIALCAKCLSQVKLVHAPVCERCGWPKSDIEASCLRCSDGYSFSRHRFALIYGDAATDLILKFKHGDRPELARRLASWMVKAGAELLEDADVITPVPIHWTRLLTRQYNQSAELTRYIGSEAEVPVQMRILTRGRMTSPQGHKSATQRQVNVSNAFTARPSADVLGKHVVVIDDVFTTGATVEACSKCLLHAGASQVDVLTAAAVNNI